MAASNTSAVHATFASSASLADSAMVVDAVPPTAVERFTSSISPTTGASFTAPTVTATVVPAIVTFSLPLQFAAGVRLTT